MQVALSPKWCASRILIQKGSAPCYNNCSGNGVCDETAGRCICEGLWTGYDCGRKIGDYSIRWSGKDWWHPVARTTWQWQLTGIIDKSFNVSVYDIDYDYPKVCHR